MPRWFIKIVGYLFKMIYIADGPSDVPGFSIVRKIGGKAYRVYKPSNDAEFAQNELLLQTNRIHAYAPAHNGSESNTSIWPRLYTRKIRDRIVGDRELNFALLLKKVANMWHSMVQILSIAPQHFLYFS